MAVWKMPPEIRASKSISSSAKLVYEILRGRSTKGVDPKKVAETFGWSERHASRVLKEVEAIPEPGATIELKLDDEKLEPTPKKKVPPKFEKFLPEGRRLVKLFMTVTDVWQDSSFTSPGTLRTGAENAAKLLASGKVNYEDLRRSTGRYVSEKNGTEVAKKVSNFFSTVDRVSEWRHYLMSEDISDNGNDPQEKRETLDSKMRAESAELEKEEE